MTVDALHLKRYFVEAGLEEHQAEKMAEGVRDYISGMDLVTKKDLKAELANAKLQIVGYTVTIQTIIMALFKFFGGQ